MINYPANVVPTHIKVTIQGLPASLEAMKIVQLSDFHYGSYHLSSKTLNQAIALTQSLASDLVILTGDYINVNPHPINDLAEHLKGLQGRYGIYATLGNHDLLQPQSEAMITEALERVGIHVLMDEIAFPTDSALALVGLRFCSTRVAELMSRLNPQIPRLVIVHEPQMYDYLQPWRVDLQLSGHTHGGQIACPGLGPVIPLLWKGLVMLPKKWQNIALRALPNRLVRGHTLTKMQGLYQQNNHPLYINRGLGSHFPGRLFCPPEVTLIELTGQPQ